MESLSFLVVIFLEIMKETEGVVEVVRGGEKYCMTEESIRT